MKKSLKKRGQKFIQKFSRASLKASEEGREHIRENLIGRVSHIKSIRLLVFEWTLLISALIMMSVAQAFWFNDSYAVDAFVDGGNYIEATVGRVNSMNPLFATTSSEKVLSRLMFATLSKVDYSGHPNAGLAQSIMADEDGKVWTVKLREGLTWSDGEPITNEDVMFTVGLIQNPAVGSIYESNLEGVRVTEGENGEIVFTLPVEYADFISALEFPIVPKHELEDAQPKTLIEDDFSTNPVTSGAFYYNASQTAASETERVIYLTANPNYYMGKPMLTSFAVHTYSSKEELIVAMNNGAVTATAELSGPEVDKITNASFLKRNTNISAGAFVFFNTNSPLMKKAELRRAIRQGIDVEALREIADGSDALDYPFTSSQITLTDYPQLYGYDEEVAKAKVTEIMAGLDDTERPSITVATVNSGFLPAVTQKFVEDLRALGLDATIATYAENQDFIANVLAKRNYDILVYEIPLGADPDPLAYYHSSQASSTGLNLSNYRSTLVDDLLVAGRETLNQEMRVKKYEAFLDYWMTDVPAIALYQPSMTYIYNKNVRPFRDYLKLVTTLDRFVDVGEWASLKGARNKTP